MSARLVRSAGAIGKAYGALELVYSQFHKHESQANETYKSLYPSLRITYGQAGRDSKEFIGLLNVFLSLTPVGAKRRNFKRRYIDNKQGWRALPKDPNLIPFGYWW